MVCETCDQCPGDEEIEQTDNKETKKTVSNKRLDKDTISIHVDAKV